MFAIEARSAHIGWTGDLTLLGHGCTEADNRWNTEAEALAAIAELSQAWGCPASDLRVVSADA